MFLKKAPGERCSNAAENDACADSTLNEVVDNWERNQLAAIEKKVQLLKSIFIDVNDDFMKKQLMRSNNKMKGYY